MRPFAPLYSPLVTLPDSQNRLQDPSQNVLTPTASRSFALRNLTPRSLLIIDEFGKGTEPSDGAGLFCGVVDHLVGLGSGTVRSGPRGIVAKELTKLTSPASSVNRSRRRRAQPRVAIATHFQRVFTLFPCSRDA